MARRMEEHSEVLGLPAGSLEDKDLTLAFQSGDKGAYQAIYDRYSTRVHNVCRRMLGNPQDAQEAAQESFLRVYQALGRFNGRYQLGAWITRIATNVCLDQLRARARRPADVAQLDVIELDGDRHHEVDGPELVVMQNVEGRRVRKVLAALPPIHRAAIVLRDFEGLSYAEIGVALQLTESQVKALIHRARQNFKRSWTPLSILLPWRLLGRFKAVDTAAKDSVAQAAATSIQVAPSCTSALQQCGQYVAEKVAPLVTAALMGAAAGGAVVANGPARPEPRPQSSGKSQQVSLIPQRLKVRAAVATREPATEKKAPVSTQSDAQEAPAASETVEEPPVVPTEAATPAPTPSSAPTPEPSPSSTGTPGPEPVKSPPAPAPLSTAFGFNRGKPIPWVTPTSNKETVSCGAISVKQRVETTIADGDQSYPALLTLGADGKGLWIHLTIYKDGYEVWYPGRATFLDSSRSGHQLTLYYSGTYGSHYQAEEAGLPQDSSLDVRLTLDCSASTVVTETLVLGAS